MDVLDGAQFLVEAIGRAFGFVSHQEMNAAVDEIAFPLPAGSHSARDSMVLKDLGLIAIHLGIASSRQPSQAGSDDDDFFLSHFLREISIRKTPCQMAKRDPKLDVQKNKFGFCQKKLINLITQL
jgi:hypothetical protein